MRRILIVDDDPTTCRLIQRVLTPRGYAVETAADGPTALQMLAASPPDLLITDVMMPRLTGWSVFARARRQVPTLPIIVMSGVDTGGWHQERSLADRAVFLRKPFALDHLVATVARLLAEIRPDLNTMPVQNGDEDVEGR